eukprot:04307.XXX_223473_223619_1 [CDS] Oithona nana genome sequencing.
MGVLTRRSMNVSVLALQMELVSIRKRHFRPWLFLYFLLWLEWALQYLA